MSKDTKKFIKEFIRHVETLEAEEDPEGNGFNKEYRMIHEVQVRNRRENAFSMDVGRIETNLKKNRYKDILPYDEHRVILKPVEGEEDSDYINASKLTGVKGTGGYIASQGPLATTVIDFWRMIWEYNVEIIFMACRILLINYLQIKCKQYWNDANKSEDFGDISVYTEMEEEIASDFIQRKLRVTKGEETRMLTQFHYSGWPDHGIPDDPAHIRDLIGIMRRTRQNDEAPLLIHCSAGCGRTGAIAAIDYVWTLLEEGRFDEKFNLYELICNFREQRMSIVQTAEQYALVNQVLKSLCEEWLTKMASHTYENVDPKESVKNSEGESENIYDFGESPINTKASDLKEGKQGPEIITLPTPKPQTNQNYENLILRSHAPSEKAPAPPPPSNNNPKKPPQSVTVTQVGSSPQHLPQGGLNYVKTRAAPKPEKSLPSQRTSLKKEISPKGEIYATVIKPTKPGTNKTEALTEQPPASGPIYSEVNKQPPASGPIYSEVNTQPPAIADIYSAVDKQQTSAQFSMPTIPPKTVPQVFLRDCPK
ncbi:unnamed protein product [Lymnaea stagnalis]|uniref:protein-tyrosine-phosphatase n=1 Tax=Lymnaea stagnalis TaxID=6523 RepID=A0AAV2H3K2_LYMST